jgi:hypothetical protein
MQFASNSRKGNCEGNAAIVNGSEGKLSAGLSSRDGSVRVSVRGRGEFSEIPSAMLNNDGGGGIAI